MSRHDWKNPIVTVFDSPVELQCVKCGVRSTVMQVARDKSHKRECPGIPRRFRRVMRKYIATHSVFPVDTFRKLD